MSPCKSSSIRCIEDLPPLEEFASMKVDWIVEGIIAEGALHLITGDSGAGKSTLVSALGYAVSTGRTFLGRAVSRRPVLLLDAENPAGAVAERFRRLGIESNQDFRLWGLWVGSDPPQVSDSIVATWVDRCETKPVVIVDSLVAFHPGTENDSTETRRYMHQYRRLAAVGATILLLHHTGKAESSKDYRGSTDIKACIDIGYKLSGIGATSISQIGFHASEAKNE